MRARIEKLYPGAYTVKIHGGSYQAAGIPDILVAIDGKIIGIEVKKQKAGESARHAYDRTTILQKAQIAKMRRAGAVAGVAITVEEALELVAMAVGPPHSVIR